MKNDVEGKAWITREQYEAFGGFALYDGLPEVQNAIFENAKADDGKADLNKIAKIMADSEKGEDSVFWDGRRSLGSVVQSVLVRSVPQCSCSVQPRDSVV